MGRRGSKLCEFLWKALISNTYGKNLIWVDEDRRIFRLTLIRRNSKDWTCDSCKILMDWYKESLQKFPSRKIPLTSPRPLLLSAMKRSKYLRYFPEQSTNNIRTFQFSENIDYGNSLVQLSDQSELQQFSPDADSGFDSPNSPLLLSPSSSEISEGVHFSNNATVLPAEINMNDILSSLSGPIVDTYEYLQHPGCMDFLNYDMDTITEEYFKTNDKKSAEEEDISENNEVVEMKQQVGNVVNSSTHDVKMNHESTGLLAVGDSAAFQRDFNLESGDSLKKQNKMAPDSSFVFAVGDKTITIEFFRHRM